MVHLIWSFSGLLGKLDRTPSFYTSRSIVNLSGLSVADPVPSVHRRSSVKQSGKYWIPDNFTLVWLINLNRIIFYFNTLDFTEHDHIVTQQPYDPNYHEDDHGYNGFSRNNSADFFNFTVQAGEIPLDGSNHRVGAHDEVHGGDMPRNASTDSLKDDHKIHKWVFLCCAFKISH